MRRPGVRQPYFVEEVDGTVRPARDVMEWAAEFSIAARVVAQTQVGPSFVSTVWIGLDMEFMVGGHDRPMVFETMVFDGPIDGSTVRHPTRELAQFGHDQYVRVLREHLFSRQMAVYYARKLFHWLADGWRVATTPVFA